MLQPDGFTPDVSGKLPVENNTREIYWEYYGIEQKEAVCLLNGLAMDTRSWRNLIPRVFPEFDLLLFNYFGQSGPPGQESSSEDEPYSIPKFCGYLASVMDLLGLEKIHLTGVSYGGFVGAEFARLYPDRVHTLTVSGILLTWEMGFQMYQDLSLRFYRSTDEVFDIYTQYLYEKIFGDAFAKRIHGEIMETMRSNFFQRYKDKKHCLIRLTEAQVPYFEAVKEDPELYRAVTCPVLVMAGEHDLCVPPWYQEKIPRLIDRCRMITVPSSGHLTYLEQPDFFWGNLLKFMHAKDTEYLEESDS